MDGDGDFLNDNECLVTNEKKRSFFGQCPLTLLGLFLVLWKLPTQTRDIDAVEEDDSFWSKIRRVDFIGATFLASTNSTFLLALDFATKKGPWWPVLVFTLLFLLSAVAFWVVERFYANEPILPIELIVNRDTITPYLIAGFQIAAQFGVRPHKAQRVVLTLCTDLLLGPNLLPDCSTYLSHTRWSPACSCCRW